MDKSKKIGSEITVRISLTFQDAPDVHTLLAMTPVRERGKLVRLALQRYIAATEHPAGNVDAQIDAISQWLRNRAPPTSADIAPGGEHPAMPAAITRKKAIGLPLPAEASIQRLDTQPGDGGSMTTDGFESPSMRRWLSD